MARAYRATGDERYAKTFSRQILKWIAQTDLPDPWNAPGSAWKTIECGLRLLDSWLVSFDGFKRSESVEDVTLLLMIASMRRQALHLVAHPRWKNWLMMESNGLYSFSAIFYEFFDSRSNRKLAAERLIRELNGQILPDGMHDELSPDYQSVVFHCAANFYELALALGHEADVSVEIPQLLDKTTNVAILLSTPAFTQPKTNDCFTIHTKKFTHRAEQLLGAKPQYSFVNTNRKEGAPPTGKTASAYLPYAGFAVMRSDWGADATYMCFDTGPLGMAHTHQDKLNINVYKGKQELIYDDGGGQYDISKARDYARAGYGHNTILVDDLAQCRKQPERYENAACVGWITNEVFDYAADVYDDAFGAEFKKPSTYKPATHKREVRFCKPDLFCVSDTLTSADGNAHDYEVLFHLDTTKMHRLPSYKNGVISEFGKEYEIALIPLDEETAPIELKIVSAVTEPKLRGWYNGRNEACLHEAVTVSRKVCGVKDFRFNTLLIPVKAGASVPTVVRDTDSKVTVIVGDKEHHIDLTMLNG